METNNEEKTSKRKTILDFPEHNYPPGFFQFENEEKVSLDDLLKMDLLLQSNVKIENAKYIANNKGLYAKKKFKKGEIICYYWGKFLNEHNNSNRVLEIKIKNVKMLLDGSKACVGSYANHPTEKILTNAAYTENTNCKELGNYKLIAVVATDAIDINDEIFADYGPNYDFDDDEINNGK